MKDRLVEKLLNTGLINRSLTESLQTYIDKWKTSSFTALTETRLISEVTLADCLAELLGIDRLFCIRDTDIHPDAFDILPFRQAHTWVAFPLGSRGGFFEIVLTDPTNIHVTQSLEKLLEMPLTILVGEKEMIRKAIDKYYPCHLQIPHLTK